MNLMNRTFVVFWLAFCALSSLAHLSVANASPALDSMVSEAEALYDAEQYAKALPLLKKALTQKIESVGDGKVDVSTIAVANLLAFTASELGDADLAAEAFLKALLLGRRTQEPQELFALINLAQAHFQAGRYDTARLLAKRTALFMKDAFGERDPETLLAILDQASAELAAGHAAAALATAGLLLLDSNSIVENIGPDGAASLNVFLSDLDAVADVRGEVESVRAQLMDDAAAVQANRKSSEQAFDADFPPFLAAIGVADIKGAVQLLKQAETNHLGKNVTEASNFDHAMPDLALSLLVASLKADKPQAAYEAIKVLEQFPSSYLAVWSIDVSDAALTAAEFFLERTQLNEAMRAAALSSTVAQVLHGKQSIPYATALFALANGQFESGQFLETLSTLESAFASLKDQQTQKLTMDVLVLKARALESLGRFPHAENVYLEAIDIHNSAAGVTQEDLAYVLSNLGSLLGEMKRTDQAEKMLRRVLEIRTKLYGSNHIRIVETISNLGFVQARNGAQWKNAIGSFREAIRIWEQTPDADKSIKLSLLNSLSTALRNNQQIKEGQAISQQAASFAAKLGAEANSGRFAMQLLAAVDQSTAGNFKAARSNLDSARSVLFPEDPRNDSLTAVAGVLDRFEGNYPQALSTFNEVTEKLQIRANRSLPGALDHIPLEIDTWVTVASLPEFEAERELSMFKAFELAQYQSNLNVGTAMDRLGQRASTSDPQLSASLRQIQDMENDRDQARSALLVSLSDQDGTSIDQFRQDFENSEQNLLSLSKSLRASHPKFTALSEGAPVPANKVLPHLEEHEALIVFATSNLWGFEEISTSRAMVMHRGEVRAFDLPLRSELKELSARLRCEAALADPHCAGVRASTRGSFAVEENSNEQTGVQATHNFNIALAQEAYQTVFGEMEAFIKTAPNLLIVPDESVVGMPFPAMIVDNTNSGKTLSEQNWLLREKTFAILPSVASLVLLRETEKINRKTEPNFLGIGDPLIGSQANGTMPFTCENLPPIQTAFLDARDDVRTRLRSSDDRVQKIKQLSALPETRCELHNIQRKLGGGGRVLLHNEATEANLRALNRSGELSRYDVVSFATHGLTAGELGNHDAGLVLTLSGPATQDDDGLLTTAEIADLKLDADFVILSACNTAAGSGETDQALSGLASAFIYAGARSLLVSHWPVDSEAAARLTTDTISRLSRDADLTKPEAIQRAMLSMLEDAGAGDDKGHPFYWAPFFVVGSIQN